MRASITQARNELGRQGKAWDVRVELPPGPDGQRRQTRVRVEGTKRDAERERTRLLREQDTGSTVDLSKMTVGEYLQHWLDNSAKMRTAPQTFLRYQAVVTRHLVPGLGQHLLAKLSPLHIAGYYREALEVGGLRNKGGSLTASTVALHHQVLRSALQQAAKWRLIPTNPAGDVEPPRPRPQEVQALTREQCMQLLAGVQGDKLFAPVVLALGLGLRKGEVLALRWGDVDLDAGLATIKRSLQDGNLGFKEPKTARGRRTIDMPAFVVAALRLHRQQQAEQRELFGPDYQNEDLICSMPDGRPVRYNVTIAFHALMKRLGLPDATIKVCRHSHATLLLADGENPRVVSERLGHSDIKVTLGVYVHVLPGMQQKAASRFDTLLKG